MIDPLQEKVYKWYMTEMDKRIDYISILSQINYLAEKLFGDYEPTKGPDHPDFLDRLNFWINNVDTEDSQKKLFRLVPEIFFVGEKEFDNLYRVAFNWQIAKWFIEQIDLTLDKENPEVLLKRAANNTWFCPITDSMRINEFYHINNITSGINYRPDFHSLSKFDCSREKIKDFILKQKIERLVLLEDFVGNGSQMKNAINFAAELSIPTLIVPLIVCPKGVINGEDFVSGHPGFSFSPVIALPEGAFISETPYIGESEFFVKIRDLIKEVYTKTSGNAWPHTGPPFGPFGFDNTGGLIVTYSNCPDNTIPIIHHKSNDWKPLFYRSTRV